MAPLDLEAVLARDGPELMALSGVTGVAEGNCAGQRCIKVFVVRKTPELAARLPTTLGGFPVAIEESGEIHAQDSS
jgi:hypothetical protein